MSGPILIPPGGLEHHVTLLALTPALLAIGAAMASVVLGRGRLARFCGWCGLFGAVALQALFLLPRGAAASYPDPVGLGLVRIGWVPSGLALALGLWALRHWRPRRTRPRTWSWCARVALALALPVVQVPLIVLGCEHDAVSTRRQSWRVVVLAVATAAIPLVGTKVAMGAGLAMVALLQDGPWRPAVLLCALAELAPP